ncbi:hypothetical protein ACFFU1_16680 [Algibacter miyuki]|uniref:Uncharacterized protein n=1 Tax=Algibacter miyuki TaxID=1306933 RepID=A0ABV5H446_9FLAO|nr:hypothetical protein [Algibacter miyuki]MDN3665615.1 hypothetical protein [Algibacter miyuki]
MKNLVIQHFKNLPASKTKQFNDALQLFRKCPGKNLGQERFFNQAGYTPATLENLNYDLKKLVGITDADIRRAPSKKVIVLDPKIELTLAELENTATLDFNKVRAFLYQEKVEYPKIPTFEKGLPGNHQMKAWLQENNVETEATKKDDLLAAIQVFVEKSIYNLALDFMTAQEELNKALNSEDKKLTEEAQSFAFVPKADTKKEDVFTTAPDDVKTQIKLRDEFPFLNEDNCPEEFYILVGKKFNYYDAWVNAHAHLLVHIKDINQDASPINMTDEEVSEMALKAVENFEVNHAIWKELNHYKATGEILGAHPIFIERKLKESIEALTVEAGTKRISNLNNYIRRDNKNAEKAKDDAEKDKYLQKVVGWEVELNMIKTKFNFSE